MQSGTFLLTVSSRDVVQLLKVLNIKEDCQNIEEMPTLDFHLGDYEFPMHIADYILRNRINNKFNGKGCRIGIMPLDVPNGFLEIFLSENIVLFLIEIMKEWNSFSKKKLGFNSNSNFKKKIKI